MTRNLLDKRMKLLKSELAEMGSLVEKQIYNSIEAFKNKDMVLAKQVMDNDDKVDELNRKIEEQCLKLMAMESPVATDLRKIFTTSKIVTDLERIGDQSADIAELILEMKEMDSFLMIGHIQDMAKIATKMVKESLDAFHQHDLNHALEVKKMDIKMDELFDQVKKDIIQMIKESNDKGDLTINFLMIAKYFERIGDHVVNICEWIEFNQTGKLNNTRLI